MNINYYSLLTMFYITEFLFSYLVSRTLFYICIFFISELQNSNSENLLMEIQLETLDETLEKLRSIFMPTTKTSYLQCLDDPEILALIDPKLEPSTKELLDDVRLFLSKIYLRQFLLYVYYRLSAI